jgi:hypothetical protein
MQMFEPDFSEPPSHFDQLHRQLWYCTLNFPSFVPTDENFVELTEALEHHQVYTTLTAEIVTMYQSGEKPSRQLELACAAARRPYTRLLKRLVT